MADANIKSKCADCIFFVEHDRMGECHRYPRVEQKFLTDFCGEFSAVQRTKIEPKVIPELVELPKIEIKFVEPEPKPEPVETILWSGAYPQDKKDELITAMVQAKKRGRPFKK